MTWHAGSLGTWQCLELPSGHEAALTDGNRANRCWDSPSAIPAACSADVRAEEASDATPPSRGAPGEASKPPLIIRNWGSVGGGFVPFGAGQQKMAPKGGKVLPQGSVKAKPSAAIGAALGPNLVLPNGVTLTLPVQHHRLPAHDYLH